MNCSKILDMYYEQADNEQSEGMASLLSQVQIWLHAFICPECARQIKLFEIAKSVMCNDFFPPSPGLEDSIMAKVEYSELYNGLYEETPEHSHGALSTRGWVIVGIIVLISLVTAFFGIDFKNTAREAGASFLLPIGITIGIVLTSYCAFFIGSHLNEFRERFGL